MDTFPVTKKAVIFIDRDLFPTPHNGGKLKLLPLEVVPYPSDLSFPLDFTHSFIISDRLELAKNLTTRGATLLFILTSRGLATLSKLPPQDLAFHNVEEALDWVIEHPRGIEDFQLKLTLGAQIIKKGGLVAFPTETVYGLGANALNEEAVARIFEVKGRPLHDPLIVHVQGVGEIEELTTTIPPAAEKLIERFWPGPLTLVLPKSPLVPDVVTAGLPSVALRMPANPWARELIRLAGTPIAAPSANAFGRTSPTCARHVEDQLGGRYDYLIDGGSCRVGVESTVLSLVGEMPMILRPGGITREEIEAVIGTIDKKNFENLGSPSSSPGLLPTHYAPRTPLVLVRNIGAYAKRPDVGIIVFQKSPQKILGPSITLSPRGNLREAAANLYRAMRDLDAMNLTLIVAEKVPEEGLGAAINDRLRRASKSARKRGI